MAEWTARQRTRTEEAKANSGITSSNFYHKDNKDNYANLDLSIPPALSDWANRSVHALTPAQLAANHAYEEAYDKSMHRFQQSNWETIVADAEKGDAAAELAVAFAYDDGKHNLSVDHSRALSWFRRSAEHGSNRAAYELGGALFTAALNTNGDMTEAVRWMRVAADGGEPRAFSVLAWCCLENRGIKATPEETFHYIRVAAEGGDTRWIGWMSYCYYAGYGTPADDAKSFVWTKKGAELGDASLMFDLAGCYRDGTGVEENMEESFAWMTKALAAGNQKAAFHVGIDLVLGRGTTADEARGVAIIQKAAEAGDGRSEFQLAAWMVDGKHGVEKNVARALVLLDKSMAQGEADAFEEMSVLSDQGRPPFLVADDTRSFEYLKKAQELGPTMFRSYKLGMYYILGKGCTADEAAGVPLVMSAADDGEARAQYKAGDWLLHGNHVPKDVPRGLTFLHKSADQKNTDAINALAALLEHGVYRNIDKAEQLKSAIALYQQSADLGDEHAAQKVAELTAK